MMTKSPTFHIFSLLIAAAALVGLLAALWGLVVFVPTAGTGGAVLVTVSSALILGAVLVTSFPPEIPRWLHVTLNVLLVLGMLGTLLAAWLLINWVLFAAMLAALALFAVRPIVSEPNRQTLHAPTLQAKGA
jgi:hypothetical protein